MCLEQWAKLSVLLKRSANLELWARDVTENRHRCQQFGYKWQQNLATDPLSYYANTDD